jgi:uncharacterized membrane protein
MANKHTINESSQDEARLTETTRAAALSDGVFAITITLLVLEIHRPEDYEPGGLLHALLEQWPSYLAYAVSFLYIGVVWLNHHSLFSKLRRVNLGFCWGQPRHPVHHRHPALPHRRPGLRPGSRQQLL